MISPDKKYYFHKDKLKWFAFFLAYPFLTVAGISVTFYIFISMVLKTQGGFNSLFKIKSWFYHIMIMFLFIAALSLIFAPWQQLRNLNFTSFQLLFQLIYWVLISFFVMKYYQNIDWNNFLKWLIIGIAINTIVFYTIDKLKIDLYIIKLFIANKAARNALCFQLICIGPFILHYFKSVKKNKFYYYLSIFLLLAAVLATDGRAGSIIVILQCLIFLGRHLFFNNKWIFIILTPLLMLPALKIDFEPYLIFLSVKVQPYNPRLASFLIGQQSSGIEISEDRSILERQMHRSKGIEIFNNYPFLGVGLGNYSNYDASLDVLYERAYFRISHFDKNDMNKRNSHSSYVQILAEMGILGIIFFLLCIIPAILIIIFSASMNSFTHAIFLSGVGMLGHFYVISQAYGAITWLIIGILNAEVITILKYKKNIGKYRELKTIS